MSGLKDKGAFQVIVYGIGKTMHIAFWEPDFAEDCSDELEWKRQGYRIGAKLNPITIEQNSTSNFKSRFTRVPRYANRAVYIPEKRLRDRGMRRRVRTRKTVAGTAAMSNIKVWSRYVDPLKLHAPYAWGNSLY